VFERLEGCRHNELAGRCLHVTVVQLQLWRRLWFVWLLWLPYLGGATREYYGGPLYDVLMSNSYVQYTPSGIFLRVKLRYSPTLHSVNLFKHAIITGMCRFQIFGLRHIFKKKNFTTRPYAVILPRMFFKRRQHAPNLLSTGF
jgi:hypothetical protein